MQQQQQKCSSKSTGGERKEKMTQILRFALEESELSAGGNSSFVGQTIGILALEDFEQ